MADKRILIVEDEAIIAQDIKNRLKNLGYTVVGMAMTGQDAIDQAGQTRPHLVLMDITLRGEMNGIQAAESIRDRLDIPVVYMTGYSDTATLLRAQASEPYGHILKPFEERELYVTIEMAMHAYELKKKLKESEASYRALFETMSEGVVLHEIVYDGQGAPVDYVILKANPAFEVVTRISLAQAAGKRASELYGTGQPPYLDVYARVAATGQPERFETCFEPMQKHFSILVFSPGPGQFATVFEDITERKNAEQALRASEERLNFALNAVNDAIWDWDAVRNIVYWSPRYFTMLGYQPGELEPSFATWRKLLHPDDQPAAEQVLDRCIRGELDDYEIEARFRTRQGDWRWIHVRGRVVTRDAGGQVARMVGTHTDITERKQAQEALRESEARFRLLVENAPDAIFVQIDGKFAYVNPAFVRLMGAFTPGDLLGQPVLDRIHPDHRGAVAQRIQRVNLGREAAPPMDQKYIRLDGTVLDFQVVSVPIVYEKQNGGLVIARRLGDS